MSRQASARIGGRTILGGFLLACALVGFPGCDEDTASGTVVPIGLTTGNLSRQWQSVDSHYTVDSTVCGIACYTLHTVWESLTLGSDSSYARMSCTTNSAKYISRHNATCDSVTVLYPSSNTSCALDTGRWFVEEQDLCLSDELGPRCYAAELNADATVLSLSDASGGSWVFVGELAQ